MNTDYPSVNLHPGDSPDAAKRTEWRVLCIDDELDDVLVRLLALEGFRVEVARSGAEGLAAAQADAYDAFIVDLRLPDMFGLTVLKRIVAANAAARVIVVTGYYGEPEIERYALQAGAAAFHHKPVFEIEDFGAVLRRIITCPSAVAGDAPPRRSYPADASLGMVAVGPAMRRIVEWTQRVGRTAATVLLSGESGSGKEVVARALHAVSPRRAGPFVPVNCAAIPEGLLEAELFGYRKGAFTGANTDRPGLFEAADEGTLFLDEIGELPVAMQVHLLRSLDGGEVRRVGETRTRAVHVRIIAATNRSIWEEIRQGRFREDLYFRLAVAECHIPPLRERLEDIEALVHFWLRRLAERGCPAVTDITPGALAALRAYYWPGNVRELRNVLERAVMCLAPGDPLTERDVSEALSVAMAFAPLQAADRGRVNEACRSLSALEAHRGNRTETARSLGINRSTLWRRLKRLDGGRGDR